MRSVFCAGACALVLFAPLAPAQDAAAPESEGFWSRSAHAVNNTTPYPLGGQEAQDRGWFSGTWDGTKRIWRDGNWDLYLSGYTWHLPYAYTAEQRAQENALTWGLGIGKTLTDERNNQRSLYALIIEDSHYKPEYQIGYAWMARWQVYNDLRVGAGYTLGLMSRSDIWGYVPFPFVAPLVSVGTDRFSLFGTFIPGNASIAYFFGRVTFGAK